MPIGAPFPVSSSRSIAMGVLRVALLATVLVANSAALPRNYASLKRTQNDCICLEDNRHTTDVSGRIVSGSYSYLDPIGSLITVTYTNGADGYQEKRRVQKNFGQATSAEVVTEVLERLQGDVLSAVEATLTSSDLRSVRTSVLVSRVVDRLRPAVARATRNSLRVHRGGVTDETEVSRIVEQIMVELRPFIANRVDQQKDTQITSLVTTTTSSSSTNPEQLVSTIVNRLKVVIEGILDAQRRPVGTTTTTTTTSSSEGDLVSRIIAQLRPTIVTTVQREVGFSRRPAVTTQQQKVTTTTTTTENEFSVDLITDLVGQLRDTIQTNVNQVISSYGTVIGDVDAVVDDIIVRLQPDIRDVITATVRRRGLNYSTQKINRLNTRVTRGIRPVIRQTILAFVQLQEKRESELLSTAVVNDVANEVQRDVSSVVGNLVLGGASTRTFSQQVNDAVQDLRPRIRQAVSRVVTRRNLYISDQFYNSNTYTTLVTRVISSLRPVVEREVRRQRSQQQQTVVHQEVLQPAFVGDVASDLQLDIRTVVTEEVTVAGAGETNADIVQDVLDRLRPLLRSVVEQNLSERNIEVNEVTFFSSPAYETLVSRVLARVRVIVTELVAEARGQQVRRDVLADGFVGQVVDELRWSVQGVVEREVGAGGSDDAVLRRVLDALRQEIRTAVRVVLDRNTQIRVGAGFYDSAAYRALVDRVLDDLRVVVTQEITVVRSRFLVDREQAMSEVAANIAERVSLTVRAMAQSVVSKLYPSGATVEEMTNEVIALLRPAIESQIETSSYAHSWLSTASAQNDLFSLVVEQLRSLIVSEIRSQVSTFTTVTTTNTQQQVKNIFGVGGANTVKVHTPQYQYQYMHD